MKVLRCLATHLQPPGSAWCAWLLLPTALPAWLRPTTYQVPHTRDLSTHTARGSSSRQQPAGHSDRDVVSGRQQLAPWLETNYCTPPVQFLKGMAAPTALSWLRRRGPEVHHGLLFKLFRNREVRIFSPSKGTVSRVPRTRVLNQGEILLFPREERRGVQGNASPKRREGQAAAGRVAPAQPRAGEQEPEPAAGRARRAGGATSLQQQHTSVQAEGLSRPIPASASPHLDKLLLLQTEDLVFVNKPAMMSVQGPDPDSLEAVAAGLKRSPQDPDLKLVHRLDRRVSGVMMMARGADVAAWVSACFRDKAAQALLELEEQRCKERSRLGLPHKPSPFPVPPRETLPEGLAISRTYWALVHGRLKPGEEGRITLPVPLPGIGAGPARPAVTLYRVLASAPNLAWLELSPLTGRRHQLRYHCHKGLGAAIIGDENYGFCGLTDRDVRHAHQLESSWWASYGHRQGQAKGGFEAYGSRNVAIQLHARQIMLTRQNAQQPLKVTAPAPEYMSALLHAMGWNLD